MKILGVMQSEAESALCKAKAYRDEMGRLPKEDETYHFGATFLIEVRNKIHINEVYFTDPAWPYTIIEGIEFVTVVNKANRTLLLKKDSLSYP